MINHKPFSVLLLGILLVNHISAMENANSNSNKIRLCIPKDTHDATLHRETLSKLAPLKADNLFEILLYCIEWDKDGLEDAFGTLQNVCLTNKYLYALAHEKLFNHPTVKMVYVRFKIFQNTVLREMRDYENIHSSLNDNALACAITHSDVEFIKKLIPKLKTAKLHTMINAIDGSLGSPLIAILLHETMVKKDKSELALLLLHNGAEVRRLGCANKTTKDGLKLAVDQELTQVAQILAQQLTCDEIKEYHDLMHGSYREKQFMKYYTFIKQHHTCTQCHYKIEESWCNVM